MSGDSNQPNGGEESVDDVGGEEEDVDVAPLVDAHVQHPLHHDPAHVRLDLVLRPPVAQRRRRGHVVGLHPQHVGQHARVVQDGGVLVRVAERRQELLKDMLKKGYVMDRSKSCSRGCVNSAESLT